jgi:hypothetical protein
LLTLIAYYEITNFTGAKPDELQHYSIFGVQNALKLTCRHLQYHKFLPGYTPAPRLKGNGNGDGNGLQEGGRGEWEGVRFWPRKKREKSVLANSTN